jgi:KUP system potassium uptake protein
MTSASGGAPVVLLHHLKHNKVLHQQVILLSILSAEVPDVDEEELLEVQELGEGFYRVKATYGFMETPTSRHHALRQSARASDQAAGDQLLPRPRAAPPDRHVAHGALAQAAVRLHVAQRPLGHEFFNIPTQPGGGAGTQIEF